MSPWRDWVIGAFNRNLPFDRFVTWQLAGDLLPDATDEQRLATAFNRNHMQSQEGGIVPEEYRTEYVVDRVEHVRPRVPRHEHRVRALPRSQVRPGAAEGVLPALLLLQQRQRDGPDPYSGMPSPTLVLEDDATRAKLEALRTAIGPLRQAADVADARYDAPFEAWLARTAAAPASARIDVQGLVAHLPLDGGVKVLVPERKQRKPTPELIFANTSGIPASLQGDKDRVPQTVEGRVGKALRLVGDSHIELRPVDLTAKTAADRRLGQFERNEPFSYAIWFRLEKDTSGPLVTHCGGLFDGNRGWELILRKGGTLAAALTTSSPTTRSRSRRRRRWRRARGTTSR